MSDSFDLPPFLAQIAAIAGTAAALKLAAAKGGTATYIPQPGFLTPEHWIVEAVGYDAAVKIAKELGAGKVEIPLGPWGGNRGKVWAAIQRALNDGKSLATIARLVGVNQRTIRRHKNGYSGHPGEDERQPDLFRR